MSSIRTLLIEDNPADARLIREVLREASNTPIELEWVKGLARGLSRLSSKPMDLMLLDLGLPDSRGLATFATAHRYSPELPIIILTGLDDRELAARAICEGAQDYLVKGCVEASSMVEAIQRAVIRRRRQAENSFDRQVAELLPLVKHMAHRIHQLLPCTIEADDLISDGTVGLLDAIAKFDSAKEVKLEVYARHRIRGAILDGLRQCDQAPRSLRERKRRIQQTYHELEGELGRPVEDQEMAGALRMNLLQWHLTINALKTVGGDWCGRTVTAAPAPDELGELSDPELLTNVSPDPFYLCCRREEREILQRALSSLTAREREVIVLHYRDELMFKEIADRLGLTESRISQLHSSAVARLAVKVRAIVDPQRSRAEPPPSQEARTAQRRYPHFPKLPIA